MVKIVFIGDVQLDDRPPKTRIDDYCMEVLRNLNYIFQWCCDNEVTHLVFLGDLLNRKEVGGRARNLLLKLFTKYRQKPEFPKVLFTVGNHDTGNDVHNIKNTTLWSFVEIGYGTVTDYDPETKIAFKHHHVHVDSEIQEHGLIHPEALIWSVHASLYPTQYQYAMDFHEIKVSDPAELVVCGHIHSIYTCKRKSDKKLLVNPGHIGRNAYVPQIRDNPVQFLVVEHDGTVIHTCFFEPVKNAKKYDEIFDLEKIEFQKKVKKQVSAIIQQTNNGDMETFAVSDVLDLARKQIKDLEVIELLVKYFGELEHV